MKNATTTKRTKKPSTSPKATLVRDINKISEFGGLFDAQIIIDTKMASNSAKEAIVKETKKLAKQIKLIQERFSGTITLSKKLLQKRKEIASKKAELIAKKAETETAELSKRMSTYDYDTAILSDDMEFLYAQVKLAKALMAERKANGKNNTFFQTEMNALKAKADALYKGEKEVIPTKETIITKLDEVSFDPDAPVASTFAEEIGAKFGTVKDPTFIKNYGQDDKKTDVEDEIEDKFVSTASGYFVKIPEPTDNISLEKTSSETIKGFVKRAEEKILAMVYKTVGQEDLLKVKRIVKFSHLKKDESLPSKHFFNNPTLYPWLEKFNQVIVGAKQQAIA